ncbi:hypothetical protein PCASD_26649 [Puccinia coronata f. sp. avenae]|uniref:Uncharacterized protein n=1 Tax=Puccinia coronata f. sp. avenae TaxID=200324 RepID=A0A2N5RXC7_9BASI|nr:hypothetical protein PCASD_26649 [Puccinia coronata f. sp. avenae]
MNCSPNHPMLASGLFTASVSDAPQGNMYGNLLTPSFVQCGGIDGNFAEDVECNLATNTAISNGLKAWSTYFLSVRLQSAGDGKPPVFTYSTLTATKLPEAVTGTLDLTNQTSIIGLGHIQKMHRRFLAKYVVPATKNYIKTHLLYQPGREVQVVGSLVDFNEDKQMPVVVVSLVSVTSGHLPHNAQSSASPSPAAGGERKFWKFSPTKANQPEGPSSKPYVGAFQRAKEILGKSHTKGKGKATIEVSQDEGTDKETAAYKENSPPPSPAPAPWKRPIG